MKDKERMVLGAIAGTLVAVAGYPLTGYEAILAAEGGVLMGAGLVLRAVGFAFLGGLWAYLHKTETDRFKVFQLGLLGPAVVVAMVQGNLPKVEVEDDQAVSLLLPSLVAPAYAQTQPTPQRPRTDSLDLLIRGLLGTTVVKK